MMNRYGGAAGRPPIESMQLFGQAEDGFLLGFPSVVLILTIIFIFGSVAASKESVKQKHRAG